MCAQPREFPLDSSGIIHVAALREDHSNTFRLRFALSEQVRPALLQQALDAVAPRFPTIAAAIVSGPRALAVRPVPTPPRVVEDAGFRCMTGEDVGRCAVRVSYGKRSVALDVFHSITDGGGAAAFANTLLADYFRRAYGIATPPGAFVKNPEEPPRAEEWRDDYVTHAAARSAPPNNRRAYQLPGARTADAPRATTLERPASVLLKAARARGVSATTFVTALMFAAVEEVRAARGSAADARLPLQVVVPADARRAFDSQTLRNFSVLVMPCVEAAQAQMPFDDTVRLVDEQLRRMLAPENLAAVMASYTKAQTSAVVRAVPLALKLRAARMVHHAFGARNSCITVSNLGVYPLPSAWEGLVEGVEFLLAPRIQSPYNFGMVTSNGVCRMTFTRFCEETDLIECFRDLLDRHASEAPHE